LVALSQDHGFLDEGPSSEPSRLFFFSRSLPLNAIELDYAIRHFFHVYAENLDEERFDAWTGLFDPDQCTYEILSKENKDLGLPLPIMGCFTFGMIKDRVAMLAKGVLTYRRSRLLRQVSNVQASFTEDGHVLAKANLVVYQSSEEGVSSLYMVARYEATLVLVDKRTLVRKMAVIVESFGIDTMLAVPL
jgi:anthranilate 1,2-dioxygenase small subunit